MVTFKLLHYQQEGGRIKLRKCYYLEKFWIPIKSHAIITPLALYIVQIKLSCTVAHARHADDPAIASSCAQNRK